MKNIYLLSASCFLCSMILFTGCKKKDDKEPDPQPEPEPEACFTPSSRYFPTTEQVTNFTNCSKNADRSEWNFGDGGSSTLESPSHKWESNGIFDVTLTAFRTSKNSKVTKKIYVGQKGYVKCAINITQWKDTSSGFSGYGCGFSLVRATDNSNTGSYYSSAPRQYARNFTGDEGTASINEDVPLKVLMGVSSGSNGKSSQVTISDVNIIDGVKSPTGTVVGELCNFSYTVSAYTAP
jgi:PKD repeat protein